MKKPANKKGNKGVGVDFKKYKHKVGKKLPSGASNATDTTVKSRQITLPQQSVAADKSGLAVTQRNLTLKACISSPKSCAWDTCSTPILTLPPEPLLHNCPPHSLLHPPPTPPRPPTPPNPPNPTPSTHPHPTPLQPAPFPMHPHHAGPGETVRALQ